MTMPEHQKASVFAFTGCIVVAVTLLLLYQVFDTIIYGETFTFTIWFIIFQEVLLFGALSITGFLSGRTTTAVPIRISYLTSVVLFNFVALVTVILFNCALFIGVVKSKTYYWVAISETGLWLSLLLLLRGANIVHQFSHRQAEDIRGLVDQLLIHCDRIRVISLSHGWRLNGSLRELSDQIRFSEGLRRNLSLTEEVSNRLNELEKLVNAEQEDIGQKEAEQTVKEITILASRRG